MVAGLPDDGLTIEERSCVRVVVLDPADRILLFRAVDPGRPDVGTWWELPGGGMDPGESVFDTAIRELAEETGIQVRPDQLSTPNWSRIGSFQYRGVRRVQHELVLTARLDEHASVDTSGQLQYELEDYPEHRWWPIVDVLTSRLRFYPGRLPDLLESHLRGEAIDEGLEVWN
jgi:8-oxo-dGTP pyrophosphatase MutT (NUDIX family)